MTSVTVNKLYANAKQSVQYPQFLISNPTLFSVFDYKQKLNKVLSLTLGSRKRT